VTALASLAVSERPVDEPTVQQLPAPVARFAALVAGQPAIGTVEVSTQGWMRRPACPPIPLEIRMVHRLGTEFVHHIRIGRSRLSIEVGIDAYVGGQGLMKVGRTLSRGPHFDQGALIALWGEALAFPSAWVGRPDVGWQPFDERSATLVVRGAEGEIPIRVTFDPETGCPASCSADRYKSTGPKVRWTGTLGGWRQVDGILAPWRFAARWADEPYPWLELATRVIRVDVPVDDELEIARALVRGTAEAVT
jgi:hypothetical protein